KIRVPEAGACTPGSAGKRPPGEGVKPDLLLRHRGQTDLGKFLASTAWKQQEVEAHDVRWKQQRCRYFLPVASHHFLVKGNSHAGGRWFDPSRAQIGMAVSWLGCAKCLQATDS